MEEAKQSTQPTSVASSETFQSSQAITPESHEEDEVEVIDEKWDLPPISSELDLRSTMVPYSRTPTPTFRTKADKGTQTDNLLSTAMEAYFKAKDSLQEYIDFDDEDIVEGTKPVPPADMDTEDAASLAFLKRIRRMRERLDDSQLTIMSRTMRNVLSFSELVKISNICIESVMLELRTTQPIHITKGGISGRVLAELSRQILELLYSSAILRRNANDLSEGIVTPTIEKLEKFNREFRARAAMTQQRMRKQPNGPLSVILSWFS